MASGIIDFGRNNTTGRYLQGKIEWSSVADNSVNNDSDVTARIYVKKGHNDYALTDATYGTWTYGITINGSFVSGVKTASVLESYVLIGEVTARNIAHNGDGTKSIVISGYVGGPSGTSFSSERTEGSATVNLDTIPRATTIAADRADIESTLLISIDRKNKNFTYSLEYAFGTLRGYVDANGNPTSSEVKLTKDSPWFNLPPVFYTQIPNSDSGRGTLYCRTYSGNTQIGDTQSTSFYAVASRSLCSPTLTYSAVDTNPVTTALTGDENILVKNHSVVHCQVQGLPKNSATIKTATVNGKAVTLDASFCGSLDTTVVSGTIPFYVQDSRGFGCTEESAHTLIDYTDLTCTVAAARTDPTSGKANLAIEGKFFNGSFTAVDNVLTIMYKVNGGEWMPVDISEVELGEEGYSVTALLTDLDYQKSHTIEVLVKDRIKEIRKSVTIGKGIPVFDWGENDFRFNVPVSVMGTAFESLIGSLVPIKLTESNIDSGSPNSSKLNIGYGIIGNVAYISFYIGWIILQFKVADSDKIYKRTKYGNNAWGEWTPL